MASIVHQDAFRCPNTMAVLVLSSIFLEEVSPKNNIDALT
jgi:hypothetical protein